MVQAGASRDLTVAVGVPAAVGRPGELCLDLGPYHPSGHGGLRLHLELAGDRVARCAPEVGFMHRGVEKLFEVRDYRQVMVLANRHDWLSAFANELGVALAVEHMLGIEVPPRATWLRTLLAELNRVVHHLAFLGSYPWEPTDAPRPAWASRELLLGLLEEVSGGRMHYGFNRVGGVREDAPAGWLDRVVTATTRVRARLPELGAATTGSDAFVERTHGVAVASRETVLAHGMSGPVARASGVDLDLRRDEPSLAYADLAAAGVLRVATASRGDALARFEVLLEQVSVSLDLVDACEARLRELPPGPVNVRLPKVVKAPEGSTYAWTESPGGLNGYLLVSRGDKTPWRLKLRTPGFNNASALSQLLVGCALQDLVPALASLFLVVGDIDK